MSVLNRLGIFESLSPTRAQGLAAMLQRTKQLALERLIARQRLTSSSYAGEAEVRAQSKEM